METSFVKSIGSAGRLSLCNEWIAGRLAQALQLQIPPFQILWVSDTLVQGSLFDGIQELGSGSVFGSQKIEHAQEFTLGHQGKTSRELAQKVLLFDWWIQNGDRSLTQDGGNSNLLWSPGRDPLYIIDHNLAFDTRLDPALFWATHVFSYARKFWDDAWSHRINGVLTQLTQQLDQIWDEIPESWRFLDSAQSWAVEPGLAEVASILKRVHLRPDEFWRGLL